MNVSMRRIVIASTNQGKVKEIARRFAEFGIIADSLADYPKLPPVVEDGDTFAANAEKKARAVAQALGIPALADDSGLCVDALQGRPGVWSARFAGEHATDAENIAKLLEELQKLQEQQVPQEQQERQGPQEPQGPENSASPAPAHAQQPDKKGHLRLLSPASFVCALALFDPHTGALLAAEGRCSGWIVDAPRGNGGFGYDPVFYLPEFGKTMAELAIEQKNAISHRGRALDQLLRSFTA